MRWILLLLMASPAFADERSLVGLEATGGVYDGFGAGVRIGDARVGVHAILAWQPLIVTTRDSTNPQPNLGIHAYSTFQANADLYVLLSEPTPRTSVGFTIGYKGSNYLGHGAGAGFYCEIDAHKQWSYFINLGVWVFPQGADRLRAREMFPAGTDLPFPGPGVNSGANAGIVRAF